MGLFSCFRKKQSPEEKFWGWIGEKSTELDIAHLDVSKIPDNTGEYELYTLSQLRDYIKAKKQ